jgi:hypothetical protein
MKVRATSPNRAYLATCLWHSAKIQPNGGTSDTLIPFHAISLNERLVVEEYTVMRKAEHQSPSKATAAPWIYAEGKGEGCYEDGQTYVGKWLVFVPYESVDEVWERIRKATEKGRLGISGKVSTSRPGGYKSTEHVICVYTYDFRDKANVGEALKGLREIGITGRLYYKTDQATLGGVYSKGGPFTKKKQRASLYSSDDFEK